MSGVNSEVDVVAMPSLKTDGTPDQTDGFKVIAEGGEVKDGSEYEEVRPFTQQTPDVATGEPPAEGTPAKTSAKAGGKTSASS